MILVAVTITTRYLFCFNAGGFEPFTCGSVLLKSTSLTSGLHSTVLILKNCKLI